MAGFKRQLITLESIKEMHAEGLTVSEMRERAGASKSTVAKWLARAKLPANPEPSLDYTELKRLFDEGKLRTDEDVARFYGIGLGAAQKRRQRAGALLRPSWKPRTTPEKLELALELVRDEKMSYRAAAQVADVPEKRLAAEHPGLGWSPQHSGHMRNMERQAEVAIAHAWPAYADKYAAA